MTLRTTALGIAALGAMIGRPQIKMKRVWTFEGSHIGRDKNGNPVEKLGRYIMVPKVKR